VSGTVLEFDESDLRSIPPTRTSLLARAKAGDGDALAQLARWYRPPLLRFVETRGFCHSDAEDLVQEVLTRVLVERAALERVDLARGRFRSFVLGVAKNVMREWARRNPRHAPLLDGGIDKAAAEIDPDAGFEIARARVLVEEALETLRSNHPAEWFVFDLRARNKSYREIAEIYDRRHADVAGRERLTREYIDNKYRKAKDIVRRFIVSRLADEAATADEVREEIRLLKPYMAQVWPHPEMPA